MSSMPPAIGEFFNGFFHEFSIVRAKWRLYEQLFGTAEAVDLLNRHGAQAFGLVEDILIKDVILSITRMLNTSKASWGDPANLASVLIDLTAHKQMALAKRLTAIRDRTQPIAEGLRRWRNEKLSRNDYAVFVGMRADSEALPANYRKMVADVLSAMGEILEELQAHYTGIKDLHENVPQPGDFDELLCHLREFEELQAKSRAKK